MTTEKRNSIHLGRLILGSLASLLLASCSQVDSTISRDAGLVADMSMASVAYRQKIREWPASALALDSFSKSEGLQFRSDAFQLLAFSPTGDVCTVHYVVAGGMTKGSTTIGLKIEGQQKSGEQGGGHVR